VEVGCIFVIVQEQVMLSWPCCFIVKLLYSNVIYFGVKLLVYTD